jgi:hypothetical protein
MQAGSSVIKPADVVRDFRVMLDAQLSMREHVSQTAQACFLYLHRLHSVRQQLGHDVNIKLVVALVFSRLDYCNAVLATLAPLQRVLHAATRLVNGLRPCDHVTSTLKELLWLPIAQRIDYKLCLLSHKSINGNAPVYLTNLLTFRLGLRFATLLTVTLSSQKTRLKLGERALSIAAPLV